MSAAAVASSSATEASHSHSHHFEDGEENEIEFVIPDFDSLAATLADESAPIAKRMRTVFLLKQLGDKDSILALSTGIASPSVLLSHECAYVLGQLQNPIAIPALSAGLRDQKLDPIVRHECAEALGAIGQLDSVELLEEYVNDGAIEVAETCRIAIDKLKWSAQNKDVKFNTSRFASVDPAPPVDISALSVSTLQSQLNDTSASLFDRYRAMFGLRDIGTDAAVAALCSSFGDKSAVFRHEVAYVMGQMQHPAAVEALARLLSDPNEHAMVRHEAAEAIGSIAEESTGAEGVLGQYKKDKDEIVRQSCDVALDLVDYWNSDEVVTAVKQEEEGDDTSKDVVDMRSLTNDIPVSKGKGK